MTRIPYLDLKAINAEVQAELEQAFTRVLESGWFILGDAVKDFERAFAEYIGVKHVWAWATVWRPYILFCGLMKSARGMR
jgi:dTDP-4-amino-4,6-dideoxygalactose transaminase